MLKNKAIRIILLSDYASRHTIHSQFASLCRPWPWPKLPHHWQEFAARQPPHKRIAQQQLLIFQIETPPGAQMFPSIKTKLNLTQFLLWGFCKKNLVIVLTMRVDQPQLMMIGF
ncbi:MAG: hypothetical protein MI976_07280 [Pseudomonadales bacterium]|nr:hypothetical protein [Pseudomonadales bacterium]